MHQFEENRQYTYIKYFHHAAGECTKQDDSEEYHGPPVAQPGFVTREGAQTTVSNYR